MKHLIEHLHRLAGSEDASADSDLLTRFSKQRDEAAFALLVRRHGALVRSVCRRWLREPADIDDAFQAVFLLLAQRASEIERPERLSNWLYGVAWRTARQARRIALRRRRLSRKAPPVATDDAPSIPDTDLGPLLDREIARLAEKYRLPVVLCLMQGLTRQQASQRLRWPEGTLSTRLAYARTVLRRRLLRRGITPALLAAGGVDPGEKLIRSTARLAIQAALGPAFSIPSNVSHLTQGVARMQAVRRIVIAAGLLVATMLTGTGVSVLAGRLTAADPPDAAPKSSGHSTPTSLIVEITADATGTKIDRLAVIEAGDTISFSSERALATYLKRVRKAEPALAATITVQAPSTLAYDRVAAIFVLCRDAGFQSVKMDTRTQESTIQRGVTSEYRIQLAADKLGRFAMLKFSADQVPEQARLHDRKRFNGRWAGELKSGQKVEWIIAGGHLLSFIKGETHGGEIRQAIQSSDRREIHYRRDEGDTKNDYVMVYQFVDDNTLRITATTGPLSKFALGAVKEGEVITLRRMPAPVSP